MEKENYADPIDLASAQERKALDSKLEEHKERVKPTQVKNPDGTWPITVCVKCGEDIGEKRLEAAIKNTLCIDCATLAERT